MNKPSGRHVSIITNKELVERSPTTMNIISIATLLVVIAMASATRPDVKHYDIENAQEIFAQFMKEHNRSYKDDADKELHYQAFVLNLKEINRLNEMNPSATYAVNKFADYTDEEKKSMRGMK